MLELKERSKISTMHIGVFWPSDIVERVEDWRRFDQAHQKRLRLITSTALSEKGNYELHLQLARIILRRYSKDHEFEDGTKALVPLPAGRHAGSSIDWAEDLCQDRSAGSSEEEGRHDARKERPKTSK